MAFALQEEVLVDELSPEELIIYVCKMMGIEDFEATVREIISEYDLYRCKNLNLRNCSKTERKKLSMALSLCIGDSKVVMLDDPTADMDVASKRAMWEIIKKHKKNRIIILATQDMEEAQLVSDRIGLIAHGSLKICGSPKFFATKF